jgi:hypothetical protein
MMTHLLPDLPQPAALPLRSPASTAGSTASSTAISTGEGWHVRSAVEAGWDVFTIPHGGYLLALAGQAVLAATGAPDIFTITVHYLRKASIGPLDFEVRTVGGSRRFTTVTATATQNGKPVLSVMASVGDREGIEGPAWSAAPAWDPKTADLSAPAGDPSLDFEPPTIANRFGLRLDTSALGFPTGTRMDSAQLRAVLDTHQVDQLTALLACDITPPAAWNALGAEGWVPTVELTAHVRARPAPGPMTVVATTNHVSHGFLDEDAVVHDAEGTLIVQSRQLARWTA